MCVIAKYIIKVFFKYIFHYFSSCKVLGETEAKLSKTNLKQKIYCVNPCVK